MSFNNLHKVTILLVLYNLCSEGESVEITVAKHAGHCFGVKTAMQKAFETARNEKQPVYTLGPIIHNPQVVDMLEKEGVKSVKNLSEIDEGVIIIRSHGVSPRIIEKAEAKGLTVVDATCPFVRRAQKLGQELVQDGYTLVLLGDAAHPEVEGIVGTVDGAAIVVSGPQQIRDLPSESRYALIAQTTQSLENLQQVASELLTKTCTLKVCNTICNATRDLQWETQELANKVDVMLVVGGKNSANTTRLSVLSENAGVPTYHIETSEEIKPEWFEGKRHIGVTAGTSTPDWIIESILKRLREQNSER